MNIAEMENHHDQYRTLESKIKTMVEDREFPGVFSICEASFPHIVPAINYRKKRGIEPETPRFSAINVICKYAPALFEHAVLEALFDFVKSTRLLAKHENGYLQTIESALEAEEMARVLWDYLEARPQFMQRDIREEVGVSQERAVGVVEIWEELGVMVRKQERNSYSLDFRTRLDAVVEGICQTCGVRGKAQKDVFFKPTSCKKCGADGYYHIVYVDH